MGWLRLFALVAFSCLLVIAGHGEAQRVGRNRAQKRLRSQSSSSSTSVSSKSDKKIVCYYTNWSQYRPNSGKFTPEDIEADICTHIIFAFGWMKKHKLSSFDSTDETKMGKKGTYEKIIDLKKKNPNLKILLAVGGWSFGTQRFKDMASNRYNRQLFVFSALEFLRERKFDGLDLDWEFPRGNEDKKNFVSLLKDLREAFEEEAKEKKLPRLLLTAAVSAGVEAIRGGYDVPAVAAYLDFLNIMSYDFHGKWEKQTGHNSPLYAQANETQWRKQLSMDFGVKLWEQLGAPKDKIVVGMATYGRSFTLSDEDNTGMNAPAKAGGKAGVYTREEGFLAYYEICEMLHKGAYYQWDDEQKVPYAYLGDQWVGFDDERSIRNKMKWIKDNGYNGAMVWTVDMDDFRGECGGKTYPLIGIMGEELLGKPVRPQSNAVPMFKITEHRRPPPKRNNKKKPTAAPTVANEVPETAPAEDKEENQVSETESNARTVCYFTNWSVKRPGVGKFEPEHIDPTLCTHVIIAFAHIKDSKLAAMDKSEEEEKGLYGRVLALKKKNPTLKVLLSVGGWMVGSEPFRDITKSGFRTSTFVFNAIEYLRKFDFDGLDVDWEFPRGPEDKKRLSTLVKELREAFEGEAKTAKKRRLILSAAVPANVDAIAAGYDVAELNKFVDMLSIMTYDFHGDWERQVGHNSPLFALASATEHQKKLTVDYSAGEWVKLGASKEKLVIGLPTYGRTFTLSNTSLTDIGAPSTEGGKPGKYTGEPGFLAFFEVCDLLKSGATLVWDNEQMVPYAYKGDQWVGFDDLRSVKLKVQWLKQAGYSGFMIWSVDMDDFRGTCTGQKYPLLQAVKDELKGYQVANLEAESSNVHNAYGQLIDPKEIVCEEEDGIITYHIDKENCSMYYMCEGKRRHHMPCPPNLVFNINESVCDWPENVPDCKQPPKV